MDQHLSSNQNDFIWTLLANGGNDAHVYAHNLQRLVNDFPQSGILHALYVHANDDKNLKKASAYFNGESLYKLINTPSVLTGVPPENIIIQGNILGNGYYKAVNATPKVETPALQHENDFDDGGPANYFNEQPTVERGHETHSFSGANHFSLEEETPPHLNGADTGHHLTDVAAPLENEVPKEELPDIEHHSEALIAPVENIIHTEEVPEHVLPELSAVTPHTEAIAPEHELSQHNPEAENTPAVNALEEPKHEVIEPLPAFAYQGANSEQYAVHEPVFEDINKNLEAESVLTSLPEEVRHPDEKPLTEELPVAELENKVPPTHINTEPEKLIVDSIASTDFFMFDRAFGIQNQAQPAEHFRPSTAHAPTNSETKAAPDHRDVSKYHDETMPYSFMWWLAKTRREHAGTYRPYVTQAVPGIKSKAKTSADPLQQQYYENIFHLTSVDELDKNTTPPPFAFSMKRKEHAIIDRFIQEEPQIKPQASDKIDNENKAKKSSEDRDELVTETLAAIYGDQMLFHKAIASYKKLMLKFPEKSAYFAGKIEQLEKKTN